MFQRRKNIRLLCSFRVCTAGVPVDGGGRYLNVHLGQANRRPEFTVANLLTRESFKIVTRIRVLMEGGKKGLQ